MLSHFFDNRKRIENYLTEIRLKRTVCIAICGNLARPAAYYLEDIKGIQFSNPQRFFFDCRLWNILQ